MDLKCQYSYVMSSRHVLMEYCMGISNDDFLAENSNFGTGSIRNLLIHIGNTYEFWLGKRALNLDIDFTEYMTIKNASQAKEFFLTIDKLVARFIEVFSDKLMDDLVLEIKNTNVSVSPFKLFTHVITHEFHHKGQILSLSRHLGYIPVDTDVIR